METFKSGNSSPLLEKIFKFGIPAALIWGGIKLWNYMAPTLIEAAKNIWLFAAIVAPLILIGGWIAMNPKMIWMMYLGMCKKLTSFIIKTDPLSIMDGYLISLKKKFANLETTRVFIDGKKIKLERMIQERLKSYSDNQKNAIAAKKQGEESAARMLMTKAGTDKQTVDLYNPILEKYKRNSAFLSQLSDNWKTSIETLGYTIERKREEYQTFKEMYKGLRSTEDFISSDSEEAQAYGMSVKLLEDDLSQKIAYINEFEKKAKPLMTTMKIEKQAQEDEAMMELEKLIQQDSTIHLPDYTTFSVTKEVQTIPYENVKKYGL